MPYQRDPNELGALWLKESAKGEYMTGTIAGQAVVCFRVRSGSGKAPTWRVLTSQPRDGQSDETRRLDTRESARRPSRVDDVPPPSDDDLGGW